MAFQLTKQQQAVVDNRGGELLVAAAAGSGKTRVLVERLLARILSPEASVNINDFVVITFTKAAAAELKERIGKELNSRLAEDLHNRQLRLQLTYLQQAKITTIHSFCGDMIRENAHILGVNPTFVQSAEQEQSLLQDQALDIIFEREYANKIEPERIKFLALVDLLSPGRDDSTLRDVVLDIYSKIQSHADPKTWFAEEKERWSRGISQPISTTMWGELLLTTLFERVKYAKIRLKKVEEILDSPEAHPVVRGNYGVISSTVEQLEKLEKLLEKACNEADEAVWDEILGLLPVVYEGAGRKGTKVEKAEASFQDTLEKVKAIRSPMMEETGRFALGDTSENIRKSTEKVGEMVGTLLSLVETFSGQYQEEKRRLNLLDFNDLEHLAVKLLTDAEGSPTALAEQYSKDIVELMVDEYQDTNRVQNAIFKAVTNQGQKLFMVGDIKQSIYRFRLADPNIFSQKFRDFHDEETDGEAPEGTARRIFLSSNFRSRKEVLYSCNDLFAEMMTEEFGEVNYKTNGQLIAGADGEDNSAFCPKPEEDYYDTEFYLIDASTSDKKEDSGDKYMLEARWVAKKIRSMIEEGFQVTGENGEPRALVAGDIMLLLRSYRSASAYYTLAFAEQDIPLSTTHGEDIFQEVEVQVLLSLLKIIDNPLQDVALISVLRSPLFGFTPEELALLRHSCGGSFYYGLVMTNTKEKKEELAEKRREKAKERGEDLPQEFEENNWRNLSTEEMEEIEEKYPHLLAKRDAFLEQLDLWRRMSREKTPKELLRHLVETLNFVGVYTSFAGTGVPAQNIGAFCDLLGGLQDSGCSTLFDCLYRFHQLERLKKLPPIKNSQRSSSAVSLQSIHNSKGLEKPVVFVAGLAKKFNTMDFKRAMLFHQDYGVGPVEFDSESQVKTSTLQRDAVKLKLRQELISEELRLLYVAMTRAKEKLILSMIMGSSQDEESGEDDKDSGSADDGGLTKGMKQVQKHLLDAQLPLRPMALYQKNSLGELVLTYVLTRTDSHGLHHMVDPEQLCPCEIGVGYQPTVTSSWKIIWVDGKMEQNSGGIPLILDESAQGEDEAEGITWEEQLKEQCKKDFLWEYPFAEAVNTPSKITATQLKGRPLLQEDKQLGEIAMEDVVEDTEETGEAEETAPLKGSDFSRRVPSFQQNKKLSAAERGTAMHLLMEYLDLSNLGEKELSVVEIEGKMQQLLAERKLSVDQFGVISPKQVKSFLDSQWGKEARNSPCCRQEYKFSLLDYRQFHEDSQPEELLLQGVVDCFYLNPKGNIVIVDFKSDKISKKSLEEKGAEHSNQMHIYAKALERMLGQKVETKVLWFFDKNAGVLVPHLEKL